MSPLELGLIGAAHIHTPNFIKRILARDDVRVKSVWDHEAARAERRHEADIPRRILVRDDDAVQRDALPADPAETNLGCHAEPVL